MTERDPDFFKLHYRQWRQRMHKLRVSYDLQGALLAIVIDTHLTGSPPADDDYALAGCMMVSPRKARAALNKLLDLKLVCIEGGLVVDHTAVEDTTERSKLRSEKAEAGREGGIRSGEIRRAKMAEASHDRTAQEAVVQCDTATLGTPFGGSASDKPLKNKETGEAPSDNCFEFELEKRREEKRRGLVVVARARATTLIFLKTSPKSPPCSTE